MAAHPPPPTRDRLIHELIETERIHVSAVTTLVNQYLEPLRNAHPPILDKTDIVKMFSNIEVIRLWNLTMLDGLSAHQEYGNTFGDLFMEMMPLLRQLYSQYSENYERAMETYERLKSNTKFSSWLDQRKLELNDTKDLRSYLFLPIQRVIAYTSLLLGILSVTSADHEDFIYLASAVQALRSVSTHADDLAAQRKNQDHIVTIHNRFTDGTQVAMPFRRFIFEGDVVLSTSGGEKNRYMVMFNDILLFAKVRKKNRLTTDFVIPIESLRAEDVKDPKRGRYQFRIIAKAAEYILFTLDKDHWLALLQNKPDGATRVAPYTRPADEDLLRRIVRWAQMDDPVLVHQQIRQFAQSVLPQPSATIAPASSSSVPATASTIPTTPSPQLILSPSPSASSSTTSSSVQTLSPALSPPPSPPRPTSPIIPPASSAS